MCLIEKKIYVRKDGHQSIFQDIVYCYKGRRRGKKCPDPTTQTTTYYNSTPSPALSNPLTLKGSYQTQTRRPSISSQPSTRDRPVTPQPEIIIEIGSKKEKGKGKDYPNLPISTEDSPHSLISYTSTVDSPGSDASDKVRTGYADTPLPLAHSSVMQARPNQYQSPLLDKSFTGSFQFPSHYMTSDEYDTPSLTTATTATTSSTTSPYTPEITGRGEDRQRRREEQRSRQMAQDRAIAANLKREENKRVWVEQLPGGQGSMPRQNSLSGQRPDLGRLASTRGAAVSPVRRARRPPISFPNNFKVHASSSHQKRTLNPFTQPAPPQTADPWDACNMRDALPDAREPYVGHSFPQQASYPMYQAFYDGEQEVGRKVRGVVDLGKRALPVSKERGNPGTNNFDRVDGVDVEDSVYNIEEVEPYTGPQKDQPTQADWVLNLGMDSNRADIAREINELGLDSASDIYSQSNESDDGNKSLYAESVFSQESTQSSATGVSAVSGYSDAEIMTATKQLVSIFLEDTTSNQLYQRAFDHPRIGSDRLQRNLHRLLKTYSQNLHHEAQGELERLASQLVAVKARYVAQCVMEEFQVKPTVKRQRQNEAKADDSDQEEAEEEDKIPPIDEDRFEDIAVLRQFLVGSAAFGTFQEQLKSFVQPKSSHLPPMFLDEENHKTESTPPAMQPTSNEQLSEKTPSISDISSSWLERARHSRNNLLIALELLEPRLPLGMTRLRWSCRCGDSFYSDVCEYRPGGIDRLKERMQDSGCLKVSATTYNRGTSEQKYRFQAPAWLRSATKRLSSTLTQASQDTSCLPQHQTSSVPRAAAAPKPNPAAGQRELYLMACMHRTEHHVVVVQDEITQLTTDRQLFQFLKRQLDLHRGFLTSVFSKRRVQKIYFVKFYLNKGHRAQVRHHRTCCTSGCECIPPQVKVVKPPMGSGEYDCNPSGPPDTWPPLCPEFMMHMLYSPDCIAEDDAYVLGQLPKKIDGKLEEVIDTPPEGWGLYFQEDVDISTIIGVIFMILFLTSLLFLILWTVLKDDIQGGSGVSAYMLAVASMLGIWVATRSRSFV